MSTTERTNYLITVSFVNDDGLEVVNPSRFIVYNALNSQHAVNSVFIAGAGHIPWESNIRTITVVKDKTTSMVVKLWKR